MKMKKVEISLLLILTLSISMLSSCGNNNSASVFTFTPALDSIDMITGVGIVSGGKYIEAQKYIYEGYYCSPGDNGTVLKSTIEDNPDVPGAMSPYEQLSVLPVFAYSDDFDIIVKTDNQKYEIKFNRLGEEGIKSTPEEELKKGNYLLTVIVYTGNWDLYFSDSFPPIDKETSFVCSYYYCAICVVK